MRFIWTLSTICIFLAIRNFACCVRAMYTLKISSLLRLQKNCQKCLLLAGATRVEARENFEKKHKYKGTVNMIYMRVWGSESFLTNIMACQTINTCRDQSFELLPPQIVTSGTIGSTSTLIQNTELNEVAATYEKYILLQSDNSRFRHQPQSSITSDTSNQMILHSNQQGQGRICLHALSSLMTVICEACLQRYSDKGTMEKYYLNHNGCMSNMYVIYTSAYTKVKSSCKERKICPSTIVAPSQSVCDLFKTRLLSPNSNVPIIEIKFDVWHGNEGSDKLIDLFTNLMYPSTCSKSQFVLSSAESDNCWSCMTRNGGLVVLDQDERFIPPFEATEGFYYRIIHFARNLKTPITCPSCGTFESSTLCMSHGSHVYTPNSVSHDNHMMDLTFNAHLKGHSVCALAVIERNENDAENKKWKTCFGFDGHVYELSSIASLIYLSTSTEWEAADISKKCLKEVTVTEFRFMPDIMCQYEFRLAELDLNLVKDLLLPSSQLTAGINEHDYTEELTLVKWEATYVKECVESLALNRKVVLISLVNKYVWMVSFSDSISNSCTNVRTAGTTYLSNSHHRQISAGEVSKYFSKPTNLPVPHAERQKIQRKK